ncbi:hypothetical protein G6F37_013050 [Rhizopus arrhizus]|nr:hypothetical protein G6F37_013050 [Rhizopus arrhizus]KAG1144546.1 hypothetical protein G6F38_006276 [Rhizopus arrhizus]
MKESKRQLVEENEIRELEKYVHFDQQVTNLEGAQKHPEPSCSENKKNNISSDEDDLFNIPIRPRKRFASNQIHLLESAYTKSDHPSRETKEKLANQFKTSTRRIQIWFQNRRAKEKRGEKGEDNKNDDRRSSTHTTASSSSSRNANIYLFKNENVLIPDSSNLNESCLDTETKDHSEFNCPSDTVDRTVEVNNAGNFNEFRRVMGGPSCSPSFNGSFVTYGGYPFFPQPNLYDYGSFHPINTAQHIPNTTDLLLTHEPHQELYIDPLNTIEK